MSVSLRCFHVTHSPGHMRPPCVSSPWWSVIANLPALAVVSFLPWFPSPPSSSFGAVLPSLHGEGRQPGAGDSHEGGQLGFS